MQPNGTNRDLLRHLVATVVFRLRVAVADAPAEFGIFQITDGVRTPAEILAHIGDLLQGSLILLKGEFVRLSSDPQGWNDELARAYAAAAELDIFLAGNEPLQQPIEKLTQGPIADALTHIGQIMLLRRAAGSPAAATSYFEADVAKLS